MSSNGSAVGLEHLYSPLQVGTMALKNRIHIPSHGAGVGSLLGTEDEALRFIQYYGARAREVGPRGWVAATASCSTH